jgi:hypothetical protein
MEQSESINELAVALVKAQAVIEGAKKDSANPFFKSKYADLESVWGVCRPPLTENGLAVVQTTEPNEHGITLVTTLVHTSGQWMRGKLSMRPVKDDPQGLGSCLTYARRYALAALVGVVQVDDDGNDASNKGSDEKKLPGPAKLSDRAVRPPDAPPLTLTGDDDPLLTDAQRKKLFAMVNEHGVPTEDMRAFCLEKFGVNSRAELRFSHLTPLATWIRAHKKAEVA